MATEKQINANRQNAQKSTGPRTAQGKAASSKNAVEHVLFAIDTVIEGENQTDYDEYLDNFLAELEPEGMLKTMLVERFVNFHGVKNAPSGCTTRPSLRLRSGQVPRSSALRLQPCLGR